MNTTEILKEVVKLYQDGNKASDVAKAGQIAIARGLSELAVNAADKKKLIQLELLVEYFTMKISPIL